MIYIFPSLWLNSSLFYDFFYQYQIVSEFINILLYSLSFYVLRYSLPQGKYTQQCLLKFLSLHSCL